MLFFCTSAMLGQNQNNVNQNFPEPVFEHLTIEDGLPENSVRSILQDHLGYMWFGTQNGLVRYDGYKMRVYRPDPDDPASISDRQITTIYEDRSGHLWVGTGVGLNCFDRATETFTRYVHNPDDSTSIGSDHVTSIWDTRAGNLLVGTSAGLNIYDGQTKSFKHISCKDSDFTGVRAIIEDGSTGNVYVAVGNQILVLDSQQGILTSSEIDNVNSELGVIHSFLQVADGTIWIGHSRGLASFNPENQTIRYYHLTPSFDFKGKNDIGQLTEDGNGLLWGARTQNFNYGLVCFNPATKQFKVYGSIPDNPKSLSRNNVWSVCQDKSGILWVGTGWGGLNTWDRKKERFRRFRYDTATRAGPFNTIDAITEDHDSVIWFGTVSGLHSFDRVSNVFNHYRYATEVNNVVTSLYADTAGTIWLGTLTKGVGRFNPATGAFRFFSYHPPNDSFYSGNNVRSILPENNDVLWIATRGGGVEKFSKKSWKIVSYMHDQEGQHSLSQTDVNCIYKDRAGLLWVGNNWRGGLHLFDRTSGSFKVVPLQGNRLDHKERSTADYTITTIIEDSQGLMWIGTYDNGLHVVDRETGAPVSTITEKDGLANNQVASIVEDGNRNLWIGTAYGLSRLNLDTHAMTNYFPSPSFKANSYYLNSACKTCTGELVFGTGDGFIMFHPDSIQVDPVPPQVVITSVSLFNRGGEELKYHGFIPEMKQLNLSYDENDLRFDYVGLHYGDPSKNRYKYMLEGYDDDWVSAGTQRNAVYTNLDAGEYVFRVQACNLDGVWNEEGASIAILIPPPLWKTWWAYALYMVFTVGVLYGLRRYELNRLHLKSQVKLDEVKLKEREETDRMKSRFFANISHEFRTPLTLILGPIQKWREHTRDDEEKKDLGMAERNAHRLLRLINQLLDLSKLEAGGMKLQAAPGNIVSFVKGIAYSFESSAGRRGITLTVEADADEIELYFDRDKLDKVFVNLLSNAFKFTPEGGRVSVSLRGVPPIGTTKQSDNSGEERLLRQTTPRNDGTTGDSVAITIADTGIGISADQLDKIFDRFYQVDASQTREQARLPDGQEGTGIGLALTKELVELHYGSISVSSEVGKGTEFTVRLLLGKDHLKADEVVEASQESASLRATESSEVPPSRIPPIGGIPESGTISSWEEVIARLPDGQASTLETTPRNDSLPIVLVVEDNADVRAYIRQYLDPVYQVCEAKDGQEGVENAKDSIPDLIISDVMMPRMDGNELCKTLKLDEKTSHIPIILLTAKAGIESKIEGLETGADDYLVKPFDANELLVRMKNLIDLRRKLRERFSVGQVLKPGEIAVTSIDDAFLQKAMTAVENEIGNEHFGVDELSKAMNMSRSQLFRKLTALTDQAPREFIRYLRLHRGNQLLQNNAGTVSEVAYQVGFNSVTYFTKCFQEQFGQLPSEVRKEQQ
jgi:signal transduction histidine kinase/ligand-binding sensor domain-containing protein/DNA-binding response OmpR family regulator